jgi:hypothetical protein
LEVFYCRERWKACNCGADESRYVSPLKNYLPETSTGELRWLHATLGASMPYRQAMQVMRLLLPTSGRDNHVTLRNHTVSVGGYRTNNAVKLTSAPYQLHRRWHVQFWWCGRVDSMSRNSIYSFGASFVQGPIKVGVAYLNVHSPNQSFFGNNQLSSTTGNNLGATTGVQSNPVYGGFASASTYQVIGAGAQYGNSTFAVGANYSNIRFGSLEDPASGTLSLTNPFGYSGTAVFNSYATYGQRIKKIHTLTRADVPGGHIRRPVVIAATPQAPRPSSGRHCPPAAESCASSVKRVKRAEHVPLVCV